MRSTLEQEREIILEQIHASREIYRQILTPKTAAAHKKMMPPDFPRSRTFQWAIDHPWVTTAGIAALIWLLSNRLLHHRRIKNHTRKNSISGSPLKALIAISAILLQNPSRLKTVERLAGTVLRWLKK